MDSISPRQFAANLFSIYGWVLVVLCTAFSVLFFAGPGSPAIYALPGYLWALLLIWVGYAIRADHRWARTAGIVLSLVHLPSFPVGTVIGGSALWCLTRGARHEVLSDRFKLVIAVISVLCAVLTAAVIFLTIPTTEELFAGFGADLPAFSSGVLKYYAAVLVWPPLVLLTWALWRGESRTTLVFAMGVIGSWILTIAMMVAIYLPIFKLGQIVS